MPTPNDEIEHYVLDTTTWPYLDSTTQPTTTTTTAVWIEERDKAGLLARALALIDELREIIQQLQEHG